MPATPLVLAHPNRLDADPNFATVAFSGGGWEPELPLTNIALRDLSKVARSFDTTLTSTRFWVDLGRTRDTRAIAIPFLRGYVDGAETAPPKTTKIRWSAYDAIDGTLIAGADTGWEDLCPVTYPYGTLPAWHPSFVDGKMSDEEWAALHDVAGMPYWHLFEASVIARYWLCEIDVGSNGFDAIDVPYAVIAPGWQASIGFQSGSLGFEDPSIIEESLGGAEFFEERDGRMVFRFSIDYLPEDEALIQVRDMQVMLGVTDLLFAILHPDDTVHRHRRAMLCRGRTLAPLEYAAVGHDKVTFELVQVIA